MNATLCTQRFRKIILPYGLVLPATILVAGMMGYAIVVAIVDSLHHYPTLVREGDFVGLANYIQLFGVKHFQDAVIRTFVFVGGSVVLGLMISFALALCLYSLNASRIAEMVRTATLIPYLISGVAAATMWRFLFSGNAGMVNLFLETLGIDSVRWLSDQRNAFIVVTLANTWKIFPMAVLILLSGLMVIDPQLYDAAIVDGAGKIRTFYAVTVPMISSYIATSLIWLTFASFNMFAVIYPMTEGGPLRATEVMALYMYRLAFREMRFSEASAVMILLLLVNIGFSFFFIRVFRKRD
ncbi:hypothetical protein AU468_10560 [Alkalispirochaeta sphaeroplastigenens]|uniref:ABC transmembrane type-1 domain-containing protein n=1 Tax=Alkalispirochaeta sphaeroplastigenens TaxID=1187066 RepID=A0A2S4JI25_9SPIO|nr:sugar ABC transporter permease [Alkalispirochaeta sphaeroplastigenens]POQ99186.1 hypothetical protein AU468_10560 [Alkalispirochaeta sphaeroplastigenens]